MTDFQRRSKRLPTLMFTGLLMSSAAPVFAQVANPSAVVPAADAAVPGDIIVTATKRSERLQNVPVSVVALTPDTLQHNGTLSTTQLPSIAPGLTYTNSGQPKSASFFIRGVGTFGGTTTLETSVGIAIDGVPMARVDGSFADLVDIDHVEVLKGPQGMLFGKNATAGLISIVTKKPQIGDTSFIGHASYGSYNENNLDGTINYSPNDKGAFRLTAWRYAHDGILRAQDGREYNDKNTYGARLGVTLKPTETLTATITGEYNGRNENGTAQTLRGYSPTSNPGVVAFNNSVGYFPDPTNDRVTRLNIPGFVKGKNLAVTGLIDLDLGSGYTLSSITSYRDVTDNSAFDVIGSDAPAFNAFDLLDLINYHQFTQEVRVASPKDRRLSFVAGLFYYDFAVNESQNTGLFSANANPALTTKADSKTTITDYLRDYSAFGEATFKIFENWRLVAGFRQSHDRTGGFIGRTVVGVDQGPVSRVAGTNGLLNFTANPVNYNFTSWRFGTQLNVSRDIMFYATASRGYKGPGFNFSPTTTPAALLTNGVSNNGNVGAETVNSYEAGIKSQFFDRRLTINITGFHSIFKNFQTTTATTTVPTAFIIANAKELQSDGVEFEVASRPAPGVSLGLNGAYVNARYTDFKTAQCYTGQVSLPAGSAFPPGTCVAGVQNLDGVQLGTSPKWTVNAFARYDRSLGERWHGYVGANYNYRSHQLYDQQNDPNLQQKGYGIANFNAGFGPKDERWTLSVYVRNAFEKFFVNRIRAANGFYVSYNDYEARRRIGAQLEVKF